ncbi:GNAT family N-acetyltransferase [Candidatus Saccharibacteria bacterium]|nr:GNAT family N-acetyltransferase [Candidatus Saccharibacteria bacterium]
MIEIKRLAEYSPETAMRVRELLIELSRSGRDKGEIPEEWFRDVITSPWHDLLMACEGEKILGIASVSIVMGAGVRKNAYLEDFVVSSEARGKGVGGILWQAMIEWGKKKGATRMEFTCGEGREAAQQFYKNHGAKIYPTNFFRIEF